MVAILVVAIIGILIVPPEGNTSETVIVQSDIIESGDNVSDQGIIDKAFQAYSIVETNRVFTESNQSIVEQFLDENDLPSSSEKFGIETQIALFDSDNEVYNVSDILGIPQLTVTDDEGRVLDLGSIQVTFESVSKQKETTTDVWGIVEFYLDDTKVDSKYIWGSGSNSDRLTLSLLDSLSVTDNIAVAPSFSAQEKKNHTFTLSDEGRDWIDKSDHTYRVVITKLHANLNSEQDYKEFHWTGQHIAYELKVKVDEKKKVVYDTTGKAIQVFKSDNTLQLCGKTSSIKDRNRSTDYMAQPPSVIVKDSDGITLLDASFSPNLTKRAGGVNTGFLGTSSCSEFVGIPRNADLVFEIDNQSFQIHTDSSQQNFYVNAQSGKTLPPRGDGGTGFSVNTNFGYEK